VITAWAAAQSKSHCNCIGLALHWILSPTRQTALLAAAGRTSSDRWSGIRSGMGWKLCHFVLYMESNTPYFTGFLRKDRFLEIRCPARGCGFESHALRLNKTPCRNCSCGEGSLTRREVCLIHRGQESPLRDFRDSCGLEPDRRRTLRAVKSWQVVEALQQRGDRIVAGTPKGEFHP
jgi:hypothetical protein